MILHSEVQGLWKQPHASHLGMMRLSVNIYLKEQGCVKLDDLIEILQRERERVGCWMNLNYIDKISDYANTLCARDWRGFGRGFGVMTGVIEVKDDGDK